MGVFGQLALNLKIVKTADLGPTMPSKAASGVSSRNFGGQRGNDLAKDFFCNVEQH